MHYCGEQLDIHGGGVDNIFPHHTNEIAQSEGYLGHKWCNYWFHNEHLMDETGKMSKSKGATLTVQVLKEKGYNPLVFRFMCLTSHYRKQLIFNYESLKNASLSYQKLKSKIKNLQTEEPIETNRFQEYDEKFKECLKNDLNTANAITLIYDLLKSNVNDSTKYKLISSWDQVLSLDLTKVETEIEINDDEIKKKIEERNEAKKEKNYELADKIRNELEKMGILLKDTKEGTVVERK